MEEIIIKYVKGNLTDELKEQFINAAIHFIIDEQLCSEADIKKIKYMESKKISNEASNCLKLIATYGYILYRTIALEIFDEDVQVRYCKLLMELSINVSKFITMESDEVRFITNSKIIIAKLGISDYCNKFVLNKIAPIKIKLFQCETE